MQNRRSRRQLWYQTLGGKKYTYRKNGFLAPLKQICWNLIWICKNHNAALAY